MNRKQTLSVLIIFLVGMVALTFVLDDSKKSSPSVWIDTYYPDGSVRGKCYNDLIQINKRQFLFVGKDYYGKTFDSSIITVNP